MDCKNNRLKRSDKWWRKSTTSSQNDFKSIPSSSSSSAITSTSGGTNRTSSCASNCGKMFSCGNKNKEIGSLDDWYGKYKTAKGENKK